MTDEQRVEQYKAGLEEWRNDSVAALLNWATNLGTDPMTTLENPHLALEPTDRMLGHEELEGLPDEDLDFLFSQLLALVAAVYQQRHGGDWAVDDDPASPTYARYVIDTGGTRFDPAQVVVDYLKARPGRSLERALAAT
jgi:hypothetical protein